ncbi:hypothetical protein AMTRI_Chr04g181550 [Amborella trichopoda]
MDSLCTDFLPHDSMVGILSFLPVQSVLRFKTVSKSWNKLLSSPSFATTHYLASSPLAPTLPLLFHRNASFLTLLTLQHPNPDPSVSCCSFCRPRINKSHPNSRHYSFCRSKSHPNSRSYSFCWPRLFKSHPNSRYSSQPQPFQSHPNSSHFSFCHPQPFKSHPDHPPLSMASSHGMVCLKLYASSDQIFFVGNPATDKYIILPRLSEDFISIIGMMGFYFNPISQNFNIFVYGHSKNELKLFMFCSLVWKWRPIQNKWPKFSTIYVRMVCTSNTLYALCNDSRMLETFDLEREIWDGISTPGNEDSKCHELRSWNDGISIALLISDWEELKIWVLSGEKNWVQMIQLDLQSLRQSHSSEINCFCMLPFLLVEDMFFIRSRRFEECKIIVYNVKDRSCRFLASYSTNRVSDFGPYRPTLFSCEFRNQ